MLVTVVLMATACFLCLAHYLAVTWPLIINRQELARPLRLDRADSFGQFMMVALLAGSAGVSLLIYQLRRYRNDDFKGNYRLWRVVLVVLLLASLNTMVNILNWGGAILDEVFGRRVALTGSDWIRLVVSLGGMILAIRLLAEVRRCRVSLGFMFSACMLLSIPEAAKWNVLQVDSLGRWLMVTSTPLLACATLFLGLVIYLRMLYREVRQISSNEPLLERFLGFKSRWLLRSESTEFNIGNDHHSEETKRSWLWIRGSSKRSNAKDTKDDRGKVDSNDRAVAAIPEQAGPSSNQKTESGMERSDKPEQRSKRRWFGLRSAKPVEAGTDSDNASSRERDAEKPGKRNRFTSGMKTQTVNSSRQSADEPTTTRGGEPSATEAAQTEQSSGRSWFRRKKKNDPPIDSDAATGKNIATESSNRTSESSQQGGETGAEEIDWNSLSKSERRRLRKQLKRQNRAA